MIVPTVCDEPGCEKPSYYAIMIRTYVQQACFTHGEERQRCLSNKTGGMGECVWCQAEQGESCRFKNTVDWSRAA